MIRAVVTGGAGFLGSHLCDRLLRDGRRVMCLDNFSTGTRANVAHLKDNPMFTVLEHDICIPIVLNADEIYNLACPASPVAYQADSVKTSMTCYIGMLNMLELAHNTGAKVLQASTSEVYGDPLNATQSEEQWGNVNPIGIRACYDEGKRIAETLCFDYHRQYGVDVKVVRIFNTYGPRMQPNDGRVITNFVTQALNKKPMTIYGDGKQTRSLCYVDDTIDGIVRMMGSEYHGPINIGNPHEMSVMEIADAIADLLCVKYGVEYMDLPQDDPQRRKPSIGKAKTLLNWEPQTDLYVGLTQTIDWLKEALHGDT